MTQPHQSSSKASVTRPQKLIALGCGALSGLFLLLTSTTFLVEGEFVYDVKRLLQLGLILILVVAALTSRCLREAFAQQIARIPVWTGGLLGLIVVLGIVSSLSNASSVMHAMYSLLEVAMLGMLVIAALVIAACRTVAGRSFDQVAITLLALTAIAVGFQELLGVAAALANDLEFFSRISLMHYSWPRFYNQVQAWTLPVMAALPLVWSRSNSELLRNRWFQGLVCLGALALHWYIILMTGGRGVALSLLVSFLICLLFVPGCRRATLQLHLPGLVAGVLLFFAIAQINEQMLYSDQPASQLEISDSTTPTGVNPADHYVKEKDETRFERQSMSGRLSLDSSGRMPMWRNSLTDIKSNPVLGIGPMNFACTGPKYRAGHPHNFALQFAGEWGIPATLALFSILAFLALTMWRLEKTLARPYDVRLGALLVTSLVAAAVYSCLSGVLVMPASQVAGILIGGWLLGLVPASQPANSARRVPAVLLALGIFIGGSVTAFSLVEADQRVYRESVIPAMDQKIPRYWQQGKICKYLDDFSQ
jgi:O-antigen ligase